MSGTEQALCPHEWEILDAHADWNGRLVAVYWRCTVCGEKRKRGRR